MKDDKRLKRKVRNSYIVSTVSITLVLFLLGSVGYLMVAALKVADTLQESIAVSVELKNGLSDEQREAIEKRLTDEEMVATIAYSPKEEKIDDQEFRKMFNSSFEEILQENQAVTVEPGIYLPEKFGVRIEDLAIVTNFGIINCTKSKKELIIL